jgi:hypothetical protein
MTLRALATTSGGIGFSVIKMTIASSWNISVCPVCVIHGDRQSFNDHGSAGLPLAERSAVLPRPMVVSVDSAVADWADCCLMIGVVVVVQSGEQEKQGKREC